MVRTAYCVFRWTGPDLLLPVPPLSCRAEEGGRGTPLLFTEGGLRVLGPAPKGCFEYDRCWVSAPKGRRHVPPPLLIRAANGPPGRSWEAAGTGVALPTQTRHILLERLPERAAGAAGEDDEPRSPGRKAKPCASNLSSISSTPSRRRDHLNDVHEIGKVPPGVLPQGQRRSSLPRLRGRSAMVPLSNLSPGALKLKSVTEPARGCSDDASALCLLFRPSFPPGRQLPARPRACVKGRRAPLRRAVP